MLIKPGLTLEMQAEAYLKGK